MSQIEQVREHLKSGKTITPLTALGLYGAFRLSHIIYVLRKEGLSIEMKRKRSTNNKPYGEYRLVTEETLEETA